METKTITVDQLDELGQMADTCDNLVQASKMPIGYATHVEQLRIGLEKLSRRIKILVVAVGGDDPWSDE